MGKVEEKSSFSDVRGFQAMLENLYAILNGRDELTLIILRGRAIGRLDVIRARATGSRP